MRIGLLAPPWVPVPPLGYGGTELVIDELARGLAADGHDVLLFATGDSGNPHLASWHYGQALGIEHVENQTAEVRHLERGYRALADVDLVHDHTLLGPGLQRSPFPVVTTMHGVLDHATRSVCAGYPDNVALVAISADQRASAPELPFAAVIHHGIDVSSIPVGTGAGGHLLFLGRMDPTKGVAAAIDVAEAAGLPLLIAAKMRTPAEHDYYLSAIRPRLTERIQYVGEADRTRKLELLGGACALLNPIDWPEPFGLVMVESLAAGTPVIATDRGAAREIVRHGRTGFLCATAEDAIAACEQLGRIDRAVCRQAAVTRFSTERMVADHELLYRQLLDHHTGDQPPARHGRPTP